MIKRLLTLRVPGSGCRSTRFTKSGADVIAEYEYPGDEYSTIGTLLFVGALAFRYTNERNSRDVPEDAYDSVVQVERSEWLSGLKDIAGHRHYGVFFSNVGYLEVVAQDLREWPDRSGTLSLLVEEGPSKKSR